MTYTNKKRKRGEGGIHQAQVMLQKIHKEQILGSYCLGEKYTKFSHLGKNIYNIKKMQATAYTKYK